MFGMGTGGPSPLLTPTCFVLSLGDKKKYSTEVPGMQAFFSEIARFYISVLYKSLRAAFLGILYNDAAFGTAFAQDGTYIDLCSVSSI